MSDPTLPLAVWQEGTLQNDIPANDNSLVLEALARKVIAIADSPSSTSDGDVFIVGPTPTGVFSAFSTDDIAMYRGGTWLAWSPVAGNVVNLAGTLYAWDGSWSAISGGGGGGGGGDLVKIAEVVTTGSQATVTFSSIPSTYRDLEMRLSGRGTASATDVEVRIRFNSDTGSNYDSLRENRFGNSNAASVGYIGPCSLPAATAPASASTVATMSIPNYKGSTFQKSMTCISTAKTGNTVSGIFIQSGGGFWRNTAAITQIDLALSSGNWVDGSVVSLYGLA